MDPLWAGFCSEPAIFKVTWIFSTAGEDCAVENIAPLVVAKLPDEPECSKGISLFCGAKVSSPRRLCSVVRCGVALMLFTGH